MPDSLFYSSNSTSPFLQMNKLRLNGLNKLCMITYQESDEHIIKSQDNPMKTPKKTMAMGRT